MAPIHDTDIAENRWSQAEWETYELWEKVEERQRRARAFWILGTIATFIIISAYPVVDQSRPKWLGERAAGKISYEINHLRTNAWIKHQVISLEWASTGGALNVPIKLRWKSGSSCAELNGESGEISIFDNHAAPLLWLETNLALADKKFTAIGDKWCSGGPLDTTPAIHWLVIPGLVVPTANYLTPPLTAAQVTEDVFDESSRIDLFE